MYKIIGADQKEYGPVSADEVRAWIVQGRANGQTLAQLEGGTWKPLATFPDFAQLLGELPPPSLAGAAPPIPPGTYPSQLVTGPGIFLAIIGALGFALHVLGLLSHVLGWTVARTQSTGNPQWDDVMSLMAGGIGAAVEVLALGMSVLVGIGGLRMTKLQNYGLCMTASVIAMVPCFSPCCCLGLPAGIWALVVLSKPEVKAAFESSVQLR